MGPGFKCFGAVRVGSNGASGGQPEVLCGGGDPSGADVATGRITWDSDLSDGFDSKWVSVQLTAGAGGTGGVKFSVTGADPNPVVYANARYGDITKVQVSSAVAKNGMKISWQQIAARFYRNGNLVDTQILPDPCQPVADTTSGGAASASQVVGIEPDALADSVVVTALVRLQATGTRLPGPQDILGQILVFS